MTRSPLRYFANSSLQHLVRELPIRALIPLALAIFSVFAVLGPVIACSRVDSSPHGTSSATRSSQAPSHSATRSDRCGVSGASSPSPWSSTVVELPATTMEFSGKLVPEDLDDLARLHRHRFYYAKFALQNWHGLRLLLAIAWATAMGLMGETQPVWWGLGAIWAVLVAITIWSVFSDRRERATALGELNAALPEEIHLDALGITCKGGGPTSFLPWSGFTRWRERGRVVMVDHPCGSPAIALSIARLSEVERQQLRDLLTAQIRPAIPKPRVPRRAVG